VAERYGAEMTVPEWHKRLVCSQCGSKQSDFVATGERRRDDASTGSADYPDPPAVTRAMVKEANGFDPWRPLVSVAGDGRLCPHCGHCLKADARTQSGGLRTFAPDFCAS
jgi:hypothetical protein